MRQKETLETQRMRACDTERTERDREINDDFFFKCILEIRTDNPSIAKKSLMVQKETERKTGKDKERETGKDRERQRKRVRGMDIE